MPIRTSFKRISAALTGFILAAAMTVPVLADYPALPSTDGGRLAITGYPVETTFSAYKIADYGADGRLTMTDDVKNAAAAASADPLKSLTDDVLNNMEGTSGTSAGVWTDLCKALDDYFGANASGLTEKPVSIKTSLNASDPTYTDIPDLGLYLVRASSNTKGDTTYYPFAFLVSIPHLDTDGAWEYDVVMNVASKYTTHTPTQTPPAYNPPYRPTYSTPTPSPTIRRTTMVKTGDVVNVALPIAGILTAGIVILVLSGKRKNRK